MIKRKVTLFFLIIWIFFLFFNNRISLNIKDLNLPEEIKDLDSYSIWLVKNIDYKSEIGDYWQSPEQTFKNKTGDCEDIAILNHQILKQLGIKSKLYYLNQGHIVSIVENNNKFILIDNQYRYYTEFISPISAILDEYPKIDYIQEFNPTKFGLPSILTRLRSFGKVIWRKKEV